MPQLDVSDAILDLNFLDKLFITRRPYTQGNNGRTVIAPQKLYPLGVVTQGSPTPMEQQPDDQYGRTAITIHAYRFQLYDPTTGAANEFQPDVLTYVGNHYIVTNVLNWSRYGRGFTMATAALYDFTNSG